MLNDWSHYTWGTAIHVATVNFADFRIPAKRWRSRRQSPLLSTT